MGDEEYRPGVAITAAPTWTLRPATTADAAAIGQLMFEAFAALDRAAGQPFFYGSLADALSEIDAMLARSDASGIVAVAVDQQMLGAIFVQDITVAGSPEEGVTVGVGPLAVAPGAQMRGIGRALLEASDASGAARARLTQDAFNNRSLCLYLSLGFRFTAPLAFLSRAAGAIEPVEWDPGMVCSAELVQDHGHDASLLHASLLGFVRPVPFSALVVRLEGGTILGYIEDNPSYPHGCATSVSVIHKLIVNLVGRHSEAAVCVGAPFDGDAQLALGLRRVGFVQVRPVNLMLRGNFQPSKTTAYLTTSEY